MTFGNIDEGIVLLKQCWRDMNLTANPSKLSALNKLKRHLASQQLSYSHENALKWLDDGKSTWDKQDYFKRRRAVYELNDVFLHGKILGNYQYELTPFDLLPDYWKDSLQEYEDYLLTKRRHRAARDQILHCTEFAAFLTSKGINSTSDITVSIISDYHKYAETTGDKYISTYSIRYYLNFLTDKGDIPRHRPYALTSPMQATASGFALAKTDVSKISILNGRASDLRLNPEEFFRKSAELSEYLRITCGYTSTTVHNAYEVHLQTLYVYLAELEIDYTPETALYWLSCLDDLNDPDWLIEYRKKSIRVFAEFFSHRKVFLIHAPHTRKTQPIGRITELEDWCYNILDDFLSKLSEDGMAKNTISNRKNAGTSFFLYLQSSEITSASQITPQIVKAYNLSVANRSPTGKNNYLSAVRQLLLFMFDTGLTSQNLSRALPSSCGKSRRIVEILTDEEIQCIYSYRKRAKTPKELRDSAILMLGLLMGLRSVDILNLRFSDIDWDKQVISITQQKTYRPLVLPLPTEAGNSIFRYLSYGRPVSADDHIFLSHIPPYGGAGKSCCRDALTKALGYPKGFHILRKTFASRLLKSGAGTDMIKDSLGHSTLDTVSRYLSVDEANVRKCCLPLKRTVNYREA